MADKTIPTHWTNWNDIPQELLPNLPDDDVGLAIQALFNSVVFLRRCCERSPDWERARTELIAKIQIEVEAGETNLRTLIWMGFLLDVQPVPEATRE